MDKELKVIKRCAACRNEKPVSEMKVCMHAQMHNYVCDSKCMNDFYNPPKKPAQLPSQGGEAVEVVAVVTTAYKKGISEQRALWHGETGADEWLSHMQGRGCETSKTLLMTVAQHQRILAAATHPADQVEDDLTMVKVSRELLQDLRDLAFDQVEHHRAAMGAYKQTRQSAMDSVLAQADALLRS